MSSGWIRSLVSIHWSFSLFSFTRSPGAMDTMLLLLAHAYYRSPLRSACSWMLKIFTQAVNRHGHEHNSLDRSPIILCVPTRLSLAPLAYYLGLCLPLHLDVVARSLSLRIITLTHTRNLFPI